MLRDKSDAVGVVGEAKSRMTYGSSLSHWDDGTLITKIRKGRGN